jgi:hypothetical protein
MMITKVIRMLEKVGCVSHNLRALPGAVTEFPGCYKLASYAHKT